MGPSALIELARKQGRLSLTEAESKTLLSHYGVPVVQESVVTNETDAAAQAARLGFPVVVKGLGANLTHKTERGLVKVDLRSEQQVRKAFRHIKESAGVDWEGCLIQPLIRGKREFVTGLFRDAQFGPVIMFGLGGIFTEALGDVVYRIAPFGESEADRMMKALLSRKLLGDFRGESAINRNQLIQTLTGLSQLAAQHPEIAEVDINPLIIGMDGRVTAVDALIILGKQETARKYNVISGERVNVERALAVKMALNRMTRPNSIAVVGAKRLPGERFRGIFEYIKDFGFPGTLYPINPNVDEIYGHKAYPNLSSLPEPVDLVIVSVPAESVPAVLKDCIASGSKHVHIFSSGFNETGEAEGISLQREIETIAREGGLHVVGPNCMGFYVPSSGVVTWPWASKKSGPVAFISQSGGNACDFTRLIVSLFKIHCSKVISYGNALTLDSTDFLEYLAQDDETRFVAMYLEGVKDGQRLLKIVRNVNPIKPVIILKAGLTKSGARAVVSHTGSMAGGEKIWSAFFSQSGAVKVDYLEEAAEMVMAFLHLGECHGRRVAILGTGGGAGVAAADECAKAGLDLPDMPQELVKELREFIPAAGNMLCNPIDANLLFFNLDLLGRALNLLSDGSYVDMFIISLYLDWLYGDSHEDAAHVEKIATYIATEARNFTRGKPLIVVWRQYRDDPEIRKCLTITRDILLRSGIPFYQGLSRGTKVLSRFARYHEFQRRPQEK